MLVLTSCNYFMLNDWIEGEMYRVIEIFMLKKEKLMKDTYVLLTSFICDGNIPLKVGQFQ